MKKKKKQAKDSPKAADNPKPDVDENEAAVARALKNPVLRRGTYWNGDRYVPPDDPDWNVQEYEDFAGETYDPSAS